MQSGRRREGYGLILRAWTRVTQRPGLSQRNMIGDSPMP